MDQGSVTRWIEQMREGDREVVSALVERYFRKLSDVARARLHKQSQLLHDQDDVANFVLEAVVRNISNGRYPDLQDRDDLWFLMLAITQRRISNILKRERSTRSDQATSLTELLESYDGEISEISSEADRDHAAIEINDCWQELMKLLPDDDYREIAKLKLDFHSNRQISNLLRIAPRNVDRKVSEIKRLWSELYH